MPAERPLPEGSNWRYRPIAGVAAEASNNCCAARAAVRVQVSSGCFVADRCHSRAYTVPMPKHPEGTHGEEAAGFWIPEFVCLNVPYMVRSAPVLRHRQRQPIEDAARLPPKQSGPRVRLAWLKDLNQADGHADGLEPMRAQWRWPLGMPPCCPSGQGLQGVRTELTGNVSHASSYAWMKGELLRSMHS